MSKLHYGVTPSDVESFIEALTDGVKKRSKVMEELDFDDSRMSKTVSLAEELRFISFDEEVMPRVLQRGRMALDPERRHEAYLNGLEDMKTYRKIKEKLIEEAKTQGPVLQKSIVQGILVEVAEPDLGERSIGIATRDLMKLINASGIAEYKKHGSQGSRLEFSSDITNRPSQTKGSGDWVEMTLHLSGGAKVNVDKENNKTIVEIPGTNVNTSNSELIKNINKLKELIGGETPQ